jgi:hypothetical protein
MKFTKTILAFTAAIVAFAFSASAQLGFDSFKGTRTVMLTPPTNILPGTALLTNGPIDTLQLGGIGKIEFLSTTNSGTTGGTLTATLYSSPDQTNLTALANFAVVTNTSPEIITNGTYLGTLSCTNQYFVTGVLTSPSAAIAGFGTPYVNPAPFTNNAAVTLLTSKNVEVGVNFKSVNRYLYVVYTIGGSATNFTVSAVVNSPAAY